MFQKALNCPFADSKTKELTEQHMAKELVDSIEASDDSQQDCDEDGWNDVISSSGLHRFITNQMVFFSIFFF